MIFESHDLLYNVMLYSDVNLFFVNKLSFKIYNNQHFWKGKTNDYRINSNNYKFEYKNINNAYRKAVDMTKVMILMIKSHINFGPIFISHQNYQTIGLNDDLYWLPDDIKKWDIQLPENKWIVFAIDDNLRFYVKNSKNYCYMMSEYEFINFFAKLFYHYSDVVVDDDDDNSFLYNQNIMEKYDELKNIDDNKLYLYEIYIKYWGLYMENKLK